MVSDDGNILLETSFISMNLSLNNKIILFFFADLNILFIFVPKIFIV